MVGNFSEVFLTPEFNNILAAAIERPFRYRDFAKMPLPRGCNREDIWRALIAIQHVLGDKLAVKPWFKEIKKEECWYYLSKSTQKDFELLGSMAAAESHYNRLLSKYKSNDYNLLPFVFNEIAVLARRDGIGITERQIEALWSKHQEPQKLEENIIANFSRVFYDLENLVSGNFFTRALIAEIHNLLIHNIGEVELPARNFFDKRLADPHIFNNPAYVSDTLDALVEAGRGASSMKDIIIVASEMSQCLWDIPYVPSLRNLTEYLMRRAFFLINDLPVLSYVPFASKLSLFGLEQLEIHEHDYDMYSEEGLNCSFMYTACVQAYLDGIIDIKDTIDTIERELEGKIARINSTSLLNERQKSFAVHALRNSEKDYTIQDYIEKFEVAYATARHDLLMLVDLGLLSMHKENKAFIFRHTSR